MKNKKSDCDAGGAAMCPESLHFVRLFCAPQNIKYTQPKILFPLACSLQAALPDWHLLLFGGIHLQANFAKAYILKYLAKQPQFINSKMQFLIKKISKK